METKLAQFSVVVVGKVHNPSILNPDFLAIRQIVPSEWAWQVEANLTTPPMALVRYDSGVSITVEMGKIQVVDALCSDPVQSKAPEITKRYVKTLPHVRYAAVGNNFQGMIMVDDPTSFLKTRFLRSGPWDSDEQPLEAFGLRLVYPIPSGRVVLSLDIGETIENEGEKKEKHDLVVANANFHRDCTSYPADDEVAAQIGQYAEDWALYKLLIHRTLGINWKVT